MKISSQLANNFDYCSAESEVFDKNFFLGALGVSAVRDPKILFTAEARRARSRRILIKTLFLCASAVRILFRCYSQELPLDRLPIVESDDVVAFFERG